MYKRQGVYLPAGATVGGELAFLPSAAPLAARAAADLQLCPTSPGEQPVAGDLDQAIAAYAAALAANPWLRVYPLALAHVTLEPPATAASTWRVRDAVSYTHLGVVIHAVAGQQVAHPAALGPVSYTHLDVYKRQGL